MTQTRGDQSDGVGRGGKGMGVATREWAAEGPAPLAGRTRLQLCAHLVALGCMLVAAACSGNAQNVCRRDPISGTERCGDTGGGYDEAAIVTGVAAGLWAAKGCSVNGCEPPFVCGAAKLCERQTCGETSDCPTGFICSASDQRCR